MSQRRRPYYLLTGLVLGLLLGLLYARVLNPPVLVNLPPARLNPADQDQYRLMIALAFQADSDLGRATARLALLGENPLADLASQAQRLLAEGGSMEDARSLALLAQALAQPVASPPVLVASPLPQPSLTPTLGVSPSLTPSSTPRGSSSTLFPTGAATFTPRPTFTPQPTAGAPFQPGDSQPVCDQPSAAGYLLVEVLDAAGKPVPGVRITVRWPGGQDVFYTGLHPQQDPGYADFSMQESLMYSVQAGEGGRSAPEISTTGCGAGVNGGWRVVFQQP